MRAGRWGAELALAGVCLIWGSTFVLVKNALADISTVLFLAIRFSIGALVLAAVYFARQRGGFRKGIPAGVLTGCFLYAGYLLQTLGLRHTTPATSGFLTGLYIVIVPLLSAAVLRRLPGFFEWTGIGLATVGMGLMTLRSARFSIGTGELLTLGCAFAFAAHILVLDHYSRKTDTNLLSLLQVATSAVIAVGTFRWMEQPVFRPTAAVMVAILVTSVLATAVAFWMQTWAQARTTATRAALIFSLEPVFAWLTSFLVEGEVLSTRALAGAACILGGILLVELKPAGSRQHL